MNKTTILKKLKNEIKAELSNELRLVSFRESNQGDEVVQVKDVIRAIDSIIYKDSNQLDDDIEVLVDGEPITMESNEVFEFSCCDCGLTHRMVIATEEKQTIGFAVERVGDE